MELCNHQFLSFFPPETGEALAQSACFQEFGPEEFLLKEGDPSDCLYLILKGSAAIRKSDPSGKSILLGYVHENDFVGEFGLIDNSPRCADAQATEQTRVAMIPRETVLEALRDPAALFRLAAHTIHQMRSANQRHVENMIRKERMSLLGGMISGILHDFRNPFTVISMSTECIQECYPEAKPYCEMISRQIEHMTNMAEDILDFSSGHTDIRKKNFQISDFFDQFRLLYEEYLTRIGITLRIDPSDLQVSGDFAKLMRVLQNLTGNASQAMRETGGALELSAYQDESEIVLRVKDNGPGIPKEIQHNLFDAFSTSGKKEGIGIGLAVAHSIITAHGGSITFDTAPEKGTAFFIRLPA